MSTEFDFYDKTNLKSYNLNESMRYQLNMLDSLDVLTKILQNIVSSVLIYTILANFLFLLKSFRNPEN